MTTGPDIVPTPEPTIVSPEVWDNYAERIDILTLVIASILDLLRAHPMIGPAVGPDFVKEAGRASERLMELHGKRETGA